MLALVLWATCLLMAVSSALISNACYRAARVRGSVEGTRALDAAEAALAIALYELSEAQECTGDAIGNCAGAIDGAMFTADVAPPYDGAGTYTIRSVGRVAGRQQGVEAVVSVAIPRMQHALFAHERLTTGGNTLVDSYDSTKGSYQSQVGSDGFAGSAGDIASNGEIHCGGGEIHGDATPGPGFTVSGKTDVVEGSTAPATSAQEMPEYSYAPLIAAGGKFSTTKLVLLPPGDHRYTEFSASSTAIVTISGKTRIWIDGDFSLSGSATLALLPASTLEIHHGNGTFTIGGGGIVNPMLSPSALTVFSATSAKFSLSGSSEFHGLINAPGAAFVSTGNAALYGAVVANTIVFSGGTEVHFDESILAPFDELTVELRMVRPDAP